MTKGQGHAEVLQEIRSLMERSSRFLSLSGLSGVAAGLIALAGSTLAFLYLGKMPFDNQDMYYLLRPGERPWGIAPVTFFALDALAVLAGALFGGIYFTNRLANRKGLPVWNALTRRLLINLAIPLFTGGVFLLALYFHGLPGLMAPSTLIFYGLALINAGKYTLDDIRYLGLSEIALGLTGMFVPGFGLELWALGFGVLHIIYGILFYHKHEREG